VVKREGRGFAAKMPQETTKGVCEGGREFVRLYSRSTGGAMCFKCVVRREMPAQKKKKNQ